MNLDMQHIFGTLVGFTFVLFIIYRRFRRLFGKQRLKRGWMIFRITLLSVVGALLLIPSFFSQELAIALIAGIAIGVGLGIWGAKHTRFENHDGVLYYIPHTYAGMVVSALFLGRIIYRIASVSKSALSVGAMDTTMGPGDFGGFGSLTHNPLTFFVFFILIGYYVYYYSYVLYESKHLKPGDMEDVAADKPAGNVT
jgi:hypothetical protein